MSQHTRTAIATDAVVSPYRFSAAPAAMIDFLELVGLSVIVRRGDYAILQGRGGRVAVHPLATAESAATVSTSLVLEVADAVVTVEHLVGAGLEATWWDESWGRQARVLGPDGLVSLNAEMTDFHGYRVSEPGPSAVEVNAVVFTDRMAEVSSFFGRLGFEPGPGEAPGWRPLRAGAGQGVIGVHQADRPQLDDHGYVRASLGFDTAEPLPALAERLASAGHRVEHAQAGTEPPTDILAVTDPDGIVIEIHPA